MKLRLETQEDIAIDILGRLLNKRLPAMLNDILNDAADDFPAVSRDMLVASLLDALAHPDPSIRRTLALPRSRTVKL